MASWPDGTYEADAWVDHDPIGNQDIRVHVAVTVDGDRLEVDFTGSDMRQDLKAYSAFGNTRGYVVAQLASMMDPSIPKNEGFFQSIELIVPEGCVLNPLPGKTVAAGEQDARTAAANALVPLREFMLDQTREHDLAVFTELSGHEPFFGPEDVPLSVLIPSFITSELKTAFQIGFLIFIPFLVIDLVVASVLMSMGMMMLSPMLISLPFKIMLFVLVDGWTLLVGTLASSFFA